MYFGSCNNVIWKCNKIIIWVIFDIGYEKMNRFYILTIQTSNPSCWVWSWKKLVCSRLAWDEKWFYVNLTHLDFNSRKFQTQSEMGMENTVGQLFNQNEGHKIQLCGNIESSNPRRKINKIVNYWWHGRKGDIYFRLKDQLRVQEL